MTRLAYDTDLSDDQWECLAPYLPAAKTGGRSCTLDLREVVNAIFYLLSNGIKWRAMPHDLPRWQSRASLLAKGKEAVDIMSNCADTLSD